MMKWNHFGLRMHSVPSFSHICIKGEPHILTWRAWPPLVCGSCCLTACCHLYRSTTWTIGCPGDHCTRWAVSSAFLGIEKPWAWRSHPCGSPSTSVPHPWNYGSDFSTSGFEGEEYVGQGETKSPKVTQKQFVATQHKTKQNIVPEGVQCHVWFTSTPQERKLVTCRVTAFTASSVPPLFRATTSIKLAGYLKEAITNRIT